jgi:hypothetical protein
MIRLLLTILLGLIVQLTALGQHEHYFGIKASGGLSYVSATSAELYCQTLTNFWRPSGQAGLFYNLRLKTKILLGADLLFSQVESKSHVDYITPDTCAYPGPFARYNIHSLGHTSYISVPIYFGYNLKNFNINVGFQTSLLLINNAEGQAINADSGSITSADLKLGIKTCDFGARIGLGYQFCKRFSIETSYYFSLINSSKGDYYYATTSRVHQILLGLRYSIVAPSGQ